MAKSRESEASFGSGELVPAGASSGPATTAGPAPGPARVIPEFRRDTPGGPATTPARLADFPAEQAAGYKRFKIHGRHPGESCWPSCYLLAATEAEARKVYLEHHNLHETPNGERAVVNCREMPD